MRAGFLQFDPPVPGLANCLPIQFENQFQETIDRITGELGVLSLTEDPLSQQMWAHYASQGAGFVVGFDADDPLSSRWYLAHHVGKL